MLKKMILSHQVIDCFMYKCFTSDENSFRSSTLRCESPFYNKKSPAINSTLFNWTMYALTHNVSASSQYDVPVIREGTTVYNQASWCDGTSECLDDLDELNCGFSALQTIFIGN